MTNATKEVVRAIRAGSLTTRQQSELREAIARRDAALGIGSTAPTKPRAPATAMRARPESLSFAQRQERDELYQRFGSHRCAAGVFEESIALGDEWEALRSRGLVSMSKADFAARVLAMRGRI